MRQSKLIVPSVSISELADINPRIGLNKISMSSKVSFIPMADVSENGLWVHRQERMLKDVRSGFTMFKDNDLLFAKITPCMENGKGAHVAALKNGVGFGSTEFHVLRAKGNNEPRFLFHWLQSEKTRVRALAYMGGSAGQQRVQAEFFNHFKIPFVSPMQQSRIAYVLDAIDDAIQKSEAVIEKLKLVREGMLHDLLTCGLDEDGRIRDPIAHPEQFRDSQLGRIPKEWEVVQIKDICCSFAGGTPSRNISEFFDGGIPWVKSTEVNQDTIVETGETISINGFNASSVKWIPADVPLFAMYGATAGQVAWLSVKATSNQAVLALVPFNEKVDARYLYWALKFEAPRIVMHATGSGQPNLNKAIIDNWIFALPQNTSEQHAIVMALDNAIEYELHEKEQKKKLELLKSGLMDDLLSGAKSVPEDLLPKECNA